MLGFLQELIDNKNTFINGTVLNSQCNNKNLGGNVNESSTFRRQSCS